MLSLTKVICLTAFLASEQLVWAKPLLLPNPITTTAYGPALYDPTTGPTCADIKQTTAPDCWLASAMCALAKCNGGFITSLIVDKTQVHPATSLSVTGATFKIWDPDTLVRTDQKVVLADTATGDGNDDSSIYVWWPSGLQAAVKKHGGSGITNGKFDVNGGYGFKALSYLTGYEATYEMDSSTWWGNLVAHVDSTPIVVCTKSDTDVLVSAHCYTAMTVIDNGDSDDTRTLRLHNPWGDTKNYK
ncbi:hypothetical protein I307_03791 [Cryptococcus deuterogattii 99/473]|uniref:Unplaced genomic scaffold supercont1.18, whole genome shotgun sequence n=1 Tax=Cryptococcus deuterogattii Ram5 TaxID=1296110 RepID=A0A0D0UUM8_9TREE|nr:hypothetical protein I309_02628 [Cryptococcus deuterogattii LA55]KIR35049.1 hypothetical protein I352_02313 [Cryptococcus deuterogattii MMRL2647]KIR37809.1 hypothetical protein I313_06173 [Cryptococcus deuterogattii Ram5]KIR93815.1 hypothetical protein I304_02494 [Cryptococcus deuterogattii CBS 10090]KIS00083.1 hypothetical protein L804_02723 [Cryptococcus deuterogattii 2001/935-1]KIY56689.1 hypothetical protein I307_03791 [Cryptococcus deuterogattii 99/473]